MSDKTAPVISVILPVYNVADYIDICMESLVNQTFSDFEMLLINDGSGDGSSAKCHEWAAKDARVRVIDKENEGVAATAGDFGFHVLRMNISFHRTISVFWLCIGTPGTLALMPLDAARRLKRAL